MKTSLVHFVAAALEQGGGPFVLGPPGGVPGRCIRFGGDEPGVAVLCYETGTHAPAVKMTPQHAVAWFLGGEPVPIEEAVKKSKESREESPEEPKAAKKSRK